MAMVSIFPIDFMEGHGGPYEIFGVKVNGSWCKNVEKIRENFEFFECLKGFPTIPEIGQMYLKVPKTTLFWPKST